MEYLVRKLSEALTQVKDEQSYIVVRERVHRNTAESTNGRVKWWSMFQLAVVIGEGVFQVWWLKRFFEVCWFLQFGCDPRWRWHANSFLICRSSVWSDLDLSLLRIECLFSDVGRICGGFEHAGLPSAIHQEIYHVFTLWCHAIILSLHNINLYYYLGTVNG